MTDTLKLKGAIVASGYTQKDIAKAIGLSAQAFWNKIHNKVEFRASEIFKLCEVLQIKDPKAIFFALFVDQ